MFPGTNHDILQKMKSCAYCDRQAPMTREHIWPDNIIESYGTELHTYNGNRQKFHKGDPVIKDVCSDCNSEKLSILDAWIGGVFNAQLKSIIQPGESVTFKYNYDLLLRSLLKISFNAARANGNSKVIEEHQYLREYILEGRSRPRVEVRLQIVTAARVIKSDSNELDQFTPTMLRSGLVPFGGKHSDKFLVRLIAFNSYYFYLVIPIFKSSNSIWREFLDAFSNSKTPTGVPIERSKVQLFIPVQRTTYFHPKLITSLSPDDEA